MGASRVEGMEVVDLDFSPFGGKDMLTSKTIGLWLCIVCCFGPLVCISSVSFFRIAFDELYHGCLSLVGLVFG